MVSKYWAQFESSGKIEDYLSFAACRGQDGEQETARMDEYAGVHHFNGNYIEAVSGGGIRQSGIHSDKGEK